MLRSYLIKNSERKFLILSLITGIVLFLFFPVIIQLFYCLTRILEETSFELFNCTISFNIDADVMKQFMFMFLVFMGLHTILTFVTYWKSYKHDLKQAKDEFKRTYATIVIFITVASASLFLELNPIPSRIFALISG